MKYTPRRVSCVLSVVLAAASAPLLVTGSGAALAAPSARADVELDADTGTVRMVSIANGALTAPSSDRPVEVAERYLRTNAAALGLSTDDLDSLDLARDYADVGGTHHLFWTQRVAGRVVDNGGLRAAVTSDGRLLMVTGTPIPDLRAPAPVTSKAGSLTTARAALAVARGLQPGGAARRQPLAAAPGDEAVRVLHADADGTTRESWEVLLTGGEDAGLTLLDAATGGLVEHDGLVSDASTSRARAASRRADGDSPASYFPYYPSAPLSPSQVPVDLTTSGWLDADATTLKGNNTHTWADVVDDDEAAPGEEVGPQEGHSWDYPFTAFDLPGVSFCDNPVPCAWDPETPYSWRKNKKQNTTQVFVTVNLFHDHLLAAPIGFTEAAGNFEQVNDGPDGKARDAVHAQAIDGANSYRGLPDSGHTDNANMFTPPDGKPPVMQMYLNHAPGAEFPSEDAFGPSNGGDGADTIYHEYTHGLSHRLVVDARGRSTLGYQGDTMGEGWSDWYAMDYVVDQGLQADDPDVADIRLFQNDTNSVRLERTEPIDCRVDDATPACKGGKSGHTGGYTLADYGHVIDGVEVHADGEIWAQTLWDVRRAFGSDVAESLTTRAMELAPNTPTFLDMRNAMLMADTANFAGAHVDALWDVFAERGMGYLAGFTGDYDEHPDPDFSTPADHTDTAPLRGTVRDRYTGKPVAGAKLRLSFSAPGFATVRAVSDRRGRFSTAEVPVGRYRRLLVTASGYDDAPAVQVRTGREVKIKLQHDLARRANGTTAQMTGPEQRFYPPASAIDGAPYNVALARTGRSGGRYERQALVLKLPRSARLRAVAIDPTVDYPGRAVSLGRYSVQASTDGRRWTRIGGGRFAPGEAGLVVRTVEHRRARYVRLTMLSNQVVDYRRTCRDGGGAGCRFTGLATLQVFGLE